MRPRFLAYATSSHQLIDFGLLNSVLGGRYFIDSQGQTKVQLAPFHPLWRFEGRQLPGEGGLLTVETSVSVLKHLQQTRTWLT